MEDNIKKHIEELEHYQELYNIILAKIEQELAKAWIEQDPNKSYLPK